MVNCKPRRSGAAVGAELIQTVRQLIHAVRQLSAAVQQRAESVIQLEEPSISWSMASVSLPEKRTGPQIAEEGRRYPPH